MHRQRVLQIVLASAAFSLAASAQQGTQPAQPSAYSGVSQPPSDPILATPDPQPAAPKPSAAVLVTATPVEPQPSSMGPIAATPQPEGTQQALYARPRPVDPDGDIVHPRSARPGELLEGATIRVRLMDRLSSTQSEKGEPFRGQVASDVLQDGRVLIPAGSAIEGRVSAVSAGHFGGHGSFRLHPEIVVLPDGSRYQLHAETTGTPGSKTKIGAEGSINPASRAKKDGIEYGAVMGTGAITGAVIGGPVGALTGTLIGAGVVTTHLMVDHPQATLEPGAVILFTLTDPMNLMPATN